MVCLPTGGLRCCSAQLGCFSQPPALFILSGVCPVKVGVPGHGAGGSWGNLPALFGVLRPSSLGQIPKDVVGAAAAWAGPGREGCNLRLPTSGHGSWPVPKGAAPDP